MLHAEIIFALYQANGIPVRRPINEENLTLTADELIDSAPLSSRALRLYAVGFREDGKGQAMPENTPERLHRHRIAREFYALGAEVAERALRTGTPTAAGSAGMEMAGTLEDVSRRGARFAQFTADALRSL
jgi:hypothetical protein